MAPGSAVLFDYLADVASTPAGSRDLRKRCADFVARRGEPWISGFDPVAMPDFLAGIGYAQIDNIEPERIGPQYFSRHPDLEYPPFIGLCPCGDGDGCIATAWVREGPPHVDSDRPWPRPCRGAGRRRAAPRRYR